MFFSRPPILHRKCRITVALLIIVGMIGTIALLPPLVSADRFDSASYTIQFGNFNITSGEKESTNYKVTDTMGQTAAGPFGAYGNGQYFIGGGFQYIYPLRDFEFALSSLAIDLGELIPGVHSSQSHTLTVSTRGAGGYIVYAIAQHPLQQSGGSSPIPFTTCDAGDCTTSLAKLWTNQNIDGFGYNMTGQDVPADFTAVGCTPATACFRPFADESLSQPMQIVMSSSNLAIDNQSTMTYKAGIIGSQAAGTYQTSVKFIAVPEY